MLRTILTRQDVEAPQFQDVRVRLPNFEGPLDLLLYLIRKDRIEIWEISLSRVTKQYLEHLSLMRVLNMEVAGEFLVMAATLMRMKSQMLLPRAEPIDDESDEPATQDELIERLLRYQTVKAAAQDLRRREEEAGRSYARGWVAQLPDDYRYPLKPVSLFRMAEVLQEMIDRQKEEEPGHTVQREDVRLEDQVEVVLARLDAGGGRLLFHDLFRKPLRPLEVAVTFMAMLELTRLQRITICQLWDEGDIWVLARPKPPAAAESAEEPAAKAGEWAESAPTEEPAAWQGPSEGREPLQPQEPSESRDAPGERERPAPGESSVTDPEDESP